MICPRCGQNHAGGCKRYVESLLEQIESLTKSNIELKEQLSNRLESNECLTQFNQPLIACDDFSQKTFDKRAYQKEYMRNRRLNNK